MADPNNRDAEFLQLLMERQQQPMNTESDRPDWLDEHASSIASDTEGGEGGAGTGQTHVFSSMMTSEEVSEKMLQAATAAAAGEVQNTDGDPTNTAAWNWRENKRPEETQTIGDTKTGTNAIASTGAGAGAGADTNAKLDTDIVMAQASLIDLINTFLSLQEQRIQTYKDFNKTFDLLLKNARLEDYPMLCGEVTARFAAVSSQILAVKRALLGKYSDGANEEVSADSKKYNMDMTVIISKVQDQEKEKLAVVAAMHLDRIQEKLPSMSSVISAQGANVMGASGGGGGQRMQHTNQLAYNTKRVREIEGAIAGLMEEVAEVKCELVLG